MASGDGGDRPTAAQRRTIRRRRSWAGAVVLLCFAADVWSVSAAGAREPVADRPAPHVSQAAATAATATTAVPPVDQAEQVPDAATDSQASGSTPARPGATGKSGGKD